MKSLYTDATPLDASIVDKLPDWWALERLQSAAWRAIDITSKYGRAFPRPDDLVPIHYVRDTESLAGVAGHFKALLARVTQEIKKTEGICAMPGLLLRRPPRETVAVIVEAGDRFFEVGRTARQIAGACVNSVCADGEVVSMYPGIEYVIAAYNNSMRDFAERYVTHVEGIPAYLQNVLNSARVGEGCYSFTMTFNMDVDLSSVSLALEHMQALAEERANAISQGPRAGKIYAMLNPSMPGLVKIGKTTRLSESRAHELSTTGVPTPFIVIYEVDVEDCDVAEQLVHKTFASQRVNDRREFFRVEPKVAVDVLAGLKS